MLSLMWCFGNCAVTLAQPPPPPIYANPAVGNSPLTVEFQFNIANVKRYSWDFGNGKVSQEKKPKTIYTNPGKYDLQVFVQYLDNSSDTIKLEDYIVVLDPVDTTRANKPDTVNINLNKLLK